MTEQTDTVSCRECGLPAGEHYNKCQYDNPPGIMTLAWLEDQDHDFHQNRAARGIACPVCGKHARYCGHIKGDMVQALGGQRWPTLKAIGLYAALDYVERVAASNQDKHGTKWLTKTIGWHDAKAVKHLGAAQADQPTDPETGLSSRAHAALRLVMALGLERLGTRPARPPLGPWRVLGDCNCQHCIAGRPSHQ